MFCIHHSQQTLTCVQFLRYRIHQLRRDAGRLQPELYGVVEGDERPLH